MYQNREILSSAVLGVNGDVQANERFPRLAEGIHLRWGFEPERGFPQYGFYLFRRPTIEPERQAEGWQLVPDAPAPLCLPIQHPDYPCRKGEEDIDDAREIADKRVLYGPPERLIDSRVLSATSTVTATEGSAIIIGDSTDWGAELTGAVFRLNDSSLDSSTYTIVQVLSSNRLVLSRPYGGASVSTASYEISEDTFGHLYDYLAHLVDGGERAGGMAARVLPTPVYADGRISVKQGETTASGRNTKWVSEFEGLVVQFAVDSDDSGTVTVGSNILEGRGTKWDETLVGSPVRIRDQQAIYIVESVRSNTELILNRPYVGERISSRKARYTIFDRETYEITEVVDHESLRLSSSFGGMPDASGELIDVDRQRYIIVSSAQSPEDDGVGQSPHSSFQYALDTILMGGLDPAIAQILGLYWVDQTIVNGQRYDYRVVADHDEIVDRKKISEEDWYTAVPTRRMEQILTAAQGDRADAFDVYDQHDQPWPLSIPNDATVFSLPGMMTPTFDGEVRDARNNAGLIWEEYGDEDDEGNPPPALFHLWRYDYPVGEGGGREPPTGSPPDESEYKLVTRANESDDLLEDAEPILRAELSEGITPDRPPEWPPFGLDTIDSGLADGWYSYRVSSLDLFGRHSELGGPAVWCAPGTDKENPCDQREHEFAIELRNRVPPPAPFGVEATILDPTDPLVRRDYYETWRRQERGNPLPSFDDWQTKSEHADRIGLRVRWRWPTQLAPDTGGFYLHYHPGRPNTLPGRTTDVDDGSRGGYSRVKTTIETGAPESAFIGTSLHVGMDAFTIVDSGDPNELWVEVRHIDPKGDEVMPRGDAPCVISVPPVYSQGTVVVKHDSNEVIGSKTEWNWRDPSLLEGRSFRTANDARSYTITQFEKPNKLTLAEKYQLPSGIREQYDASSETTRLRDSVSASYAIEHPRFADFSQLDHWQTLAFQTVQYEPSVGQARYYMEETDDGITIRTYEVVVPAPGLNDGSLEPSLDEPMVYGTIGVSAFDENNNNGPIGPPVTVYRVWREAPDRPTLPTFDSDRVYATRADYHSKSRYTFRWVRPSGSLTTHVFRAMDKTLFRIDWERRETSQVLDPSDLDLFPPGFNDPDDPTQRQRREEIAKELNRLNDFSRANGRDDALAYYRTELSNDSLRILAGLPGNEAAFTQMTTQPIAADNPAYENRPGPDDDPDDYPDDPDLQAYTDELDGRSTNRYFYRVGFVDDAQNVSALSLSSPPVYMPDVVPPQAPVIEQIVAGHPNESESDGRMITIRWNSVDQSVTHFDIFRTEQESYSRDIRLMKKVEANVPPLVQSNGVWTDEELQPFTTYFYRVVAVDPVGNVSQPSNVVAGRAYDQDPRA
ncbi:hypothetical protein [Haladaptatus sp. DFWS20]|uniref:hypothetical protein n=1 Tax=Haladaptatus sp. DFWS20 TaxID=3403467 RepID=UPI003EC10E11